MRRSALALSAAVILLATVACSTSSGSKEKFCAALPRTGDVMSIMSDFGSADPAALRKRFETGLAEYRDLERAAPRAIRADVAKIADTVELLLDVVRRHPDDLGAIRSELAGKAATLVTAGKSARTLGTYAQRECGIDPVTITLISSPSTGTAGSTTTTTG